MNQQAGESWGSRIGVILAVAGSAVGLGNFLRFPGQAAQNGGGAFMVPYFIAFLLLGIPICWTEWTVGRKGGGMGFHSSPAIFGALGKRKGWRYAGVLGVLIPIVIYMYYVVIEAWCLRYAIAYITGSVDLGQHPGQYAARSSDFFGETVGIGHDGFFGADGSLDSTFLIWIFVFCLNFALIYRGLTAGIETFCKFAMPVMALCALIVLVRVLTLGTPNPELPDQNVMNGLGFMWNPKVPEGGVSWMESLVDPGVWMAAAGQIFFSLSVGFGVIVNYASYLKKSDDVVLSGLTATSTNAFFEVCLGGMITIPAAFIFLGAAGATGGTFGLGFNALPVVFVYMPGGNFFGFVWFFMLFLAAVTSSLSMLQPGIAFMEESLNIDHKKSVLGLGGITLLGSLFVIYFSKNLAALDTLDFWVGTAGIYVLATIQVLLFGWVIGVDEGVAEAEKGAELKLPKLFPFIIKYVSPAYLLIIFAAWCVEKLPDYVASLAKGGVPLYSVALVGVVMLAFVVFVNIATRRWDAVENKNDQEAS
ncbi:MAG: sodium-dependent transporter [Polyangiaceae bacterium]|nr:sodium-dependent transporter [Polyangiaceae bacterium]